MKKGIIVILALLLVSSAILISCSTGSSTGITPISEKGWLCDNDRVGGISVLTGPSKNSQTSAFLTACNGYGCDRSCKNRQTLFHGSIRLTDELTCPAQ